MQGWGTYSNQMVVVIGMNYDETVKALQRKHLRLKSEAIEAFRKEEKEIRARITEGCNGLFWSNEGRSLLWLREWTGDWQCYETLLHELYHGISAILHKNKGMIYEEEACAYQQEFLFREIRRKIQSKIKS